MCKYDYSKIKLKISSSIKNSIIANTMFKLKCYQCSQILTRKLMICFVTSNNMKGKRKQCSLEPHASSTIHGSRGDALQHVATQISRRDNNFNLWDKGQLVVILSRTKHAKIQCLLVLRMKL